MSYITYGGTHEHSHCWIWRGEKDNPDLRYQTFKIGGKSFKVHRLAYWFFIGNIKDPSLYVCHRCDNPRCVRPDHLFLGSHQDNMDDARIKGRLNAATQFKKGEQNKDAKLTWVQVREIRKRYREKVMTQEQLAQIFGVGRSAIAAIVQNRNWYPDPEADKQ